MNQIKNLTNEVLENKNLEQTLFDLNPAENAEAIKIFNDLSRG